MVQINRESGGFCDPVRVIVVGGGPAGLACALSLRQRSPDWQVLLVDPKSDHLIVPRLHETVRLSLADVQVPFARLAERYGFEWIPQTARLDETTLQETDDSGQLRLDDQILTFDYLVIATGSVGRSSPNGAVGLEEIKRNGVGVFDEDRIDLVGGGPTAIQFAAELAELYTVRLFSSGSKLLPGLPDQFDQRVRTHLQKVGIEVQLNQRITEPQSANTLWLTGTQPHPHQLLANHFGQLLIDGIASQSIFVAGDCVRYEGDGLNAMSAQAAVKKGLHVATNIRRHSQRRWLQRYTAKELGYFIPLGKDHAIGWLGSPDRILSGSAAITIHHTIHEQYGLLLRAINPYIL